LSATAVSSSRVDLSWQDVAGESGYRVQRSADGVAGWTEVGSTGAGVVSFSDTGLAPSTAYWYRVVATSGNGDSGPSNVATATTFGTPPAAPSGLSATAVSSSRVDLSWQDV